MLANIPATQTVIEIKAPGGPEMLVPATRPVPEPDSGEVLIRIAASGVNRADCLQRMGRYPMPPGAPDIPGLECAGTVVKTGEGVREWRVGDQVCALLIGDGYGEYAAAPAVQCLPAPAGVSLVDAAGLPETFCTVWTNVFERMHLEAAEVFLVQGGTSGIGITAIQLAKGFGASVLATAGTDEKCRACLDYGADVAINYRTQDFVQVGREFTGGRGVDAILDMVGGDYIPRQLDLLAHEGRLCFVALMQGGRVEADFGVIQRKHLTVTGSTLRSRTVAQKAAIVTALKDRVWPLWETGKLRPFTYKQFPLTRAADAHRLMESSQHIGKILLVP
ncbi:MAG: NAD(P)H-quinone oxidoreductase [Alphaproteobacteria bacterium]|nr:NAD(P)H-quinone oxidoreductase [Alphaproteobacteria bacterium]